MTDAIISRHIHKLQGLEINNKNQIVGINDHVVYGEIDDAYFWNFYFRKNGKPEILKPENIENIVLSSGLVTITFNTGRTPLQFTKKGKVKSSEAANPNMGIGDGFGWNVAAAKVEAATPDDEPIDSDEPIEDSTPVPAAKPQANMDGKIGKGLSFEIDPNFKAQKNLVDKDGFCYAHYTENNHVIHFESWNGNYPKHGKIATVDKEILSIELTKDDERTIKVTYGNGQNGYFIGSVPAGLGFGQIVEETPFKYPPRRNHVDTILKAYYKGRMALRDSTPSIKINGEWVNYTQSRHLRMLLSESDEAIRQTYQSIMSQDDFENYRYQIPRTEFPDILSMLFNEDQQDTFLEWVTSEEWDGIDRLSTLHKAIGLTSTPFNEQPIVNRDDDDRYCMAIVRMIIVGAVQRHIVPYIQDIVPVIVGMQGCGKSSTLRALAGCFDDPTKGWYYGQVGSINPDHDGREFYRPQFGKAIVELVEIDRLLKKDSTGLIKGLLEKPDAYYNEKNEKGMTKKYLSAFVTGTTNFERILIDNSGNRRFAIVYMNQQMDTPNRESLKGVDNFAYTNAPLYLRYHPEYVQQLYAQAYKEYVENDEPWDFFVERENKENDIFTKVQNRLNLLALKEPENMDIFVGFMRSKCEENIYNVCNWVEIKTEFVLSNEKMMNKFQFETLFKSFKENPKRFGFSDYGTFRIANDKTVKGYRLIDKDIAINFTENYNEISN